MNGRCEKCRHFKKFYGMYGSCPINEDFGGKFVHKLDTCAAFEQRTFKVKPRRLCDFCERGKRMNSEEGEHDLRLVKLTPVSPINLTNPNEEEIKLGKPFYAMFLHDPEYGDEAATFPVKYCPFCGRKLVGQ